MIYHIDTSEILFAINVVAIK